MALKEEFEQIGGLFFRWRSYLPLFMVLLFLAALPYYRNPFENPYAERLWELGCLAISFIGLGIRFFTVGFVPGGTSGRNTMEQVAASLNTTGMYSMVRNPIYLGNLFIWLGLSLFIKTWWFTTLIVLFFMIFYERIIFAEERFLRDKFGESFLSWAEHTPAILPRLKNWNPPALPFSWKSALNREYSTFYSIIVSFTILEIIGDLFLNNRVRIDGMWIYIFVIGTIIYLTVRFLKKKTNVLSTAGR